MVAVKAACDRREILGCSYFMETARRALDARSRLLKIIVGERIEKHAGGCA